MKQKQSPCHACEQDNSCSRPCMTFQHWFRLQWRQLRWQWQIQQEQDFTPLGGFWYEWLE